MDENKNHNLTEEHNLNFQRFKSKIRALYKSEEDNNNLLGIRQSYRNRNYLDKYDELRDRMEDAIRDPNKATELSKDLYNTDSTYSDIVSFSSDMFYMRYTILPHFIGKEGEKRIKSKEYEMMYNEMLSIADGANIEIIFPSLVKDVMISGITYIYLAKDNPSRSIETFILPRSFCKVINQSQYGLPVIAFDFSYFEKLARKINNSPETVSSITDSLKITIDNLLELFPKEFKEKYETYLTDKGNLKWQPLDGRFATSFSFNGLGMPSRLSAIYGISDFNKYREIELEKTAEELEKILVHRIPQKEDGQLIFEADEAREVGAAMASSLRGVKHLKLLTTFGDAQLLELHKQKDKEAQLLSTAYKVIFSSAGLNENVFIGDNNDTKYAIRREKARIWNLLLQIQKAYNIALNNLYNWKPYQLQINLLPITVYDEEEVLHSYIENAGVGIGKLQAVVASGIKQSEISDYSELEKFLKLDDILTPLKSMHTSSNKEEKEKAEVKPEVEKIPPEEKEEVAKSDKKKRKD